MARKGKTNASKSLPDFTFIDVRLDIDDKAWLAACDISKEFPFEMLFSMVHADYKISISHDTKRTSFIVSATDRSQTSPHQNCVLSGRGSTVLHAWASLAYKHFRLAEEDWARFDRPGDGVSSEFG